MKTDRTLKTGWDLTLFDRCPCGAYKTQGVCDARASGCCTLATTHETITRAEWDALPRDQKAVTSGVHRILRLDRETQATTLITVKVTP